VSAASSLIVSELRADSEASLETGKNYLVINTSETLFARDFVSENPEVQSISYKENNKTIGFVNTLGGIGKNFILQQGVIYEVYLKNNSKVIIPEAAS
jgi:hypothetical protein